MNYTDLPERWKQRLSEWISTFGHSESGELCAYDFPGSYSVMLKFGDLSEANFQCAIVIEEPKLNEIGVFTEHCGYHIFPLHGVHVARVEL